MKPEGYCKEQLWSSPGVFYVPLSPHTIQVWRIHSISPLTPVLGNVERVLFVVVFFTFFFRRKRRRYTSRNKKILGMTIEDSQWKEVIVKAMIMEKMPGKQTGEKEKKESRRKESTFYIKLI